MILLVFVDLDPAVAVNFRTIPVTCVLCCLLLPTDERMKSDTPSKGNRLVPGGLLTSKSATFQVQSILGEGAFGKVVKCVRVGCTTPIAIKVIKNRKFYRQQAKKEVRAENFLCQVWSQHIERVYSRFESVFRQIDNLLRLKNLDHDKCSIIRIHGAFYDRGYYCMIFEHLDRSLFDYMNQQHLCRLPLFVIKWIVCQAIILLFQCSLIIINVTSCCKPIFTFFF